jgi:hypothetical protein
MDIPFDPNLSLHDHILYDDGTSSSILAASMPSLILKPVVDILDTSHLLPPLLQVGSKITFKKTANTIRGISPICPMAPIVSGTNLM